MSQASSCWFEHDDTKTSKSQSSQQQGNAITKYFKAPSFSEELPRPNISSKTAGSETREKRDSAVAKDKGTLAPLMNYYALVSKFSIVVYLVMISIGPETFNIQIIADTFGHQPIAKTYPKKLSVVVVLKEGKRICR